ncbi:MAG: multicopper oxidase family protein [Pseudomonadota bacterium]
MPRFTPNRRQALGLLGAGAAAALAPIGARVASAQAHVPLDIQATRYPILDRPTSGLFSTRPGAPPPVLRLKQHEAFAADVTNLTDAYTTMHWHGIRLPNEMDGVPYLTQFPIAKGETFSYRFASPDAGTFWYHPHCMTMEQMAQGLTGLLIVEEADDPGFDADIPLNLKDFRLNDAGEWLDLWTPRGAARGGTFGTVITTNWEVAPTYAAPAGGLVRLRIGATDTTRVYRLFLPGAAGQVIALDGHPLDRPEPIPQVEEDALLLGPGQRADIAIRVPSEEGATLPLMARVPGGSRALAVIRAEGADAGRDLAELRPLSPNPVAIPDLANARREEFVFGWSPDDMLPNNGLCGSLGYTFWSINRTPWPGDAAETAGPLATLRLGESVVLRLRNESPNDHPIHLHGLIFRPIASNKRAVRPHWTDTALLLREETMDVAFVADNPGDWAFHCHVIEHQKTGLAGYIRVEEG